MGANLLFWGWQTGLLPLGAVMAILLESSRFVKKRWDFSTKDFSRVSDLSAIILAVLFVYRYMAVQGSAARWLPIGLFPLILAQQYSTISKVDLGAIFWTMRKKAMQGGPRKTFDIYWPYFALTILASAAANIRGDSFYIGLFVLIAWALFFVRSRRTSIATWAVSIILVGSLGYIGHIGLHQLHLYVEGKAVDWFTSSGDRNPFRIATAIGDIKRLKLSDRIVFRVKTGPNVKEPFYLREAAYNFYRNSRWLTARPEFKNVQSLPGEGAWSLGSQAKNPFEMTVFASFDEGKGLLKLPAGSFKVSNLPAYQLAMNRLGTIKMEDGPNFTGYKVLFDPSNSYAAEPDDNDLLVWKDDLEALEEIKKQLNLGSLPVDQRIEVIKKFFLENFTYSLNLTSGAGGSSPISDFLAETRSGHCEYFATASVLLLRTAGIPARYASGYLVDEFSDMENVYIVRARHAHAWTLVYVNGAWENFDATPPSWLNLEAEAASPFEGLLDLWSFLGFLISEWRLNQSDSSYNWMIWLLPFLIVFLARRLIFKKPVSRDQADSGEKAGLTKEAKPSYFIEIEKNLTPKGFYRHPYETINAYIDRIEKTGRIPNTELLRQISAIHYQHQFDPLGVPENVEAELINYVQDWLTELQNLKD